MPIGTVSDEADTPRPASRGEREGRWWWWWRGGWGWEEQGELDWVGGQRLTPSCRAATWPAVRAGPVYLPEYHGPDARGGGSSLPLLIPKAQWEQINKKGECGGKEGEAWVWPASSILWPHTGGLSPLPLLSVSPSSSATLPFPSDRCTPCAALMVVSDLPETI